MSPLTNFPNGISSFGVPIVGGVLPSTQGKVVHSRPYLGLDGNDGSGPEYAVKTLTRALALATANKNDVVLLYGESNTSANTTDYQSATLDWNKDLTHLIGTPGGPVFSPRSRVAFISTYDTASNLFTLSANGCRVENIQFYAGVAGTNPTGCFRVTGNRNYFSRCHFAGIGNDANDIADAYSLHLSGAENVFEDCIIGLDTVARGTAANSDLYIAAGGLRNIFRRCLFIARVEHNTNSPHVKIAGGAMGNAGLIVMFEDCKFLSVGVNYGNVNTYAIVHVAAPTAGFSVVDGRCETNAGNWGASGNHLYIAGTATLAGYNTHLLYNA